MYVCELYHVCADPCVRLCALSCVRYPVCDVLCALSCVRCPVCNVLCVLSCVSCDSMHAPPTNRGTEVNVLRQEDTTLKGAVEEERRGAVEERRGEEQ